MKNLTVNKYGTQRIKNSALAKFVSFQIITLRKFVLSQLIIFNAASADKI
jgi:hypothetical protein